jgi:hypothetical protein
VVRGEKFNIHFERKTFKYTLGKYFAIASEERRKDGSIITILFGSQDYEPESFLLLSPGSSSIHRVSGAASRFSCNKIIIRMPHEMPSSPSTQCKHNRRAAEPGGAGEGIIRNTSR